MSEYMGQVDIRVDLEGTSTVAKGDPTTGAVLTMEHEIHEGNHYSISGYDTGVDNGDTIDFTVTTPDTDVVANMRFYVEGLTDGVKIEIYKGATGVSGGTASTPVNSNGNSTNTSDMVVKKDPTISDDGTCIFTQASGANRKIGKIDHGQIMPLAKNTTYVYRLTSLGAANNLSYGGFWCEH